MAKPSAVRLVPLGHLNLHISVMTDSISMAQFVTAAGRLKRCTVYLMPPSRKAQPSTSKQLDKIDPNYRRSDLSKHGLPTATDGCSGYASVRTRDTWTMRSIAKSGGFAATSAIAEMITSVAFPKVAFISPPRVWLVYIASSSVTTPSSAARGMSAMRAKKKVTESSSSIIFATKANGVKTSKILMLENPRSSAVEFFRYSPKGE